MCGRKTLTKGKIEIIEELFVDEWENDFDWKPSYNIAPTQMSPVLLNDGKRKVKPMCWGLVPSWAKDKTIGAKMINARSETLGEKPSFQSLIYQKRCIVISDGYFEWKREGRKKSPTTSATLTASSCQWPDCGMNGLTNKRKGGLLML